MAFVDGIMQSDSLRLDRGLLAFPFLDLLFSDVVRTFKGLSVESREKVFLLGWTHLFCPITNERPVLLFLGLPALDVNLHASVKV